MGRLKKLLNLLVLAVAGIVIWHEFIEPQRQTATDSGAPPRPATPGGGDSTRAGGTSPWDGAPSARDSARSGSDAKSDKSEPASDGLAAAVAAINTLTERVSAVAADLASRREESSSGTGSVDVSDPRQLSSSSRFQGGEGAASDEQEDQSGGGRDASAAAGDQASSNASGDGEGEAGEASRESAGAAAGSEASAKDKETTESGGADVAASSRTELDPEIAPATGAPFLDTSARAASSATDEALDAGSRAADAGGTDAAAGGSSSSAEQPDSGAGTAGEAGGGSGAAQLSVPTGAVQGDGTADCPAEYPIKGNATSRIFHEPGRASYDRTIPEFCFDSVDSATAAGFRAPRH